jgi:hypothetical protein
VTSSGAAARAWRRRRGLVLGVTAVVALGAGGVALTLRPPPDPPVYDPTPAAAAPAGDALVGPLRYTVDATSPDVWRYFSFRLGTVIDNPEPRDWDLAFRRFHILANGGPGFGGRGGIRDLGPVGFDAVTTVPAAGYEPNSGGGEPTNAAIARWYGYGYFSHRLTPKPHVWAVRTSDGRHAKLEILSYYCTGGRPGCLTFRYVYQGDGSRVVAARRASP